VGLDHEQQHVDDGKLLAALPIAWAADGKALFVPVVDPEGAKLLNVSLRGDVYTIRVNRGGNYTAGVPSPDGRHLAIESTADNRNIGMMENF
jgi:hypothetical protein